MLYDRGSDITLVSLDFVWRQGIRGKPAGGKVNPGLETGGKSVKIVAQH